MLHLSLPLRPRCKKASNVLHTTNKKLQLAIVFAALLVGGAFYFIRPKQPGQSSGMTNTALAAKFEELSAKGNSSCSATFTSSIDSMSDSGRIQGSCCSPMNMHRYTEQTEGLKKYNNIPEIPPDPYDVDAELAKKMKSYYDVELSAEEQTAYDYAMANSNENGPCCCKCWRWYVYGGLAKFLIQKYRFTGEQVTDVWNLSDGCGGPGDHANH